MEHWVFLLEVVASMLGFLAAGLLFLASREFPADDRRSGAMRFLAVGVLIQNVRVLFTALVRYFRLTNLTPASSAWLELRFFWIIIVASLAASALFLSLWLAQRATLAAPSPHKPFLRRKAGIAAIVLYLLYYAVSAGMILSMTDAEMLRSDRLPWHFTLFVSAGPIVGDKLLIILAASCWLWSRRYALPNQNPLARKARLLESSAVACLATAAVLDLILPRLPLHPALVFTTALPFYAAPFLALAASSAERRVLEAQALVRLQHSLALAESRDASAEPSLAGAGPAGPSAVDRLTARAPLGEIERLLALGVLSGRSNKEIAWELGLSLSSVKHRLYDLYRKLGVASRFELIVAAGETQD